MPPVAHWLPGMMALAVLSSGMVSLGIATAFERSYGVLKRLGGSPLPRGALVAAKLGALLAVETLQIAFLLAVALMLGWQPQANVALALAALVLGTVAFGGLGLWMAGSWRAEATLAGANALYVLLLLFGGVVVAPQVFPYPLDVVSSLLPSAALVALLRDALGLPAGPMLPATATLLAWAILAPAVAAATFRWE